MKMAIFRFIKLRFVFLWVGVFATCIILSSVAWSSTEQATHRNILSALPAPVVTASESPTRILFVGNSFSFYNNGIHNHLGSLIRSAGEWQRGTNRLRLFTLSGARVDEHLDSLALLMKKPSANWQAVVLQGHSNEPISASKRAQFISSTEQAIELIRNSGRQPILFMTWAYKHQPQMTEQLAKAYIELANKSKALVIPVGLAFAQAQVELPNIELYVPDVLNVTQKKQDAKVLTYRKNWKHPSEAGTYLAACVFYSSIYKRSPEGLIFYGDLSEDKATQLQKLSWQVTQRFYQGGSK